MASAPLVYVLPPAPRRSVRLASRGGGQRRTITLTCEPDDIAYVGFNRDSGYSSIVYLKRDWRAVEFGS